MPPQGREVVLAELHSGHLGISRMKSLMHGLVWWSGIDTEVEAVVKKCYLCQQVQPVSPPAPLHPWQWPSHPRSRLHLDFAGSVAGKMLLVVIDAYSKWIEVIPMVSITASATLQQLRKLFAQFGLPQTLVSDNGLRFRFEEFKEFCRQNGIKHIPAAPYHPSSNGLAEQAVKIVKKGMRKQSTGDLRDNLVQVFFQLQNYSTNNYWGCTGGVIREF